MSLSKFTPPRVGCKHFFSVVKSVRSQPNSLILCILDILDNIYGLAKKLPKDSGIVCDLKMLFNALYKTVHQIIISDNIPHGFKQILDQGTNNPLNMGHIREGHNDDLESAEFGEGLKNAIIYICERADIYTRSITDTGEQNFVNVLFDIPNMMSRADPQESYEPTRFELIDEEEFKKNRNCDFEYGSTMIFQSLNDSDFSYDSQTGSRFTEQQFEEIVITHLSKAYSDLIRDGVFKVILNNKEIPPRLDLTDFNIIPLKNQIRYRLFIKLNQRNDPTEIHRVGETPTGRLQYKKYSLENKFIKISSEENTEFKKDQNVVKLDLISVSTYNTEFSHILNYDLTDIVRGGRCYDPPIKFTVDAKDGWSNHIYNRLNYESKRLNKVLGVGPNKRVTKPSNMLISAIHMTMKETTKTWRKFYKYGDYDVIDEDSDSDESTITPSKKSKAASKKMSQVSKQSTTAEALPTNQPTSNPTAAAALPVTSSVADTSNVEEISQESSDISSTEIQEDLTNPGETNVSLIVTELQEETPIPVTENVSSVELQDVSQTADLQNVSSIDTISESSEKIKEASKKLMDLIADGNFNRTDGYKVLEFVESYINTR
jgi:hypothetical protein